MTTGDRRSLRDIYGSGAAPRSFTPPHLAERILKSRSALEGERKDVTILFADIVGSTHLIEHLDAEDAFERLQPALEAMMTVVHRFEGTITRSMGDGIMALFGAPLAHEDHAVRACLAGLAMQEAVSALGDIGVTIRVGLHSGQVMIRSISNDLSVAYDAVGEVVHLAARMEQLCEPGRVRCGEATERLVRGFVNAQPLGPMEVKGLSQPVQVYEVGPLPTRRTRWQVRAAQGLTEFVGRGGELKALQRAWKQTEGRDGQVVAIVGDAGVGKSRLVHEFLSSIKDDGAFLIEAAALPEGRSAPYLAVTHLMRTWLGIAAGSDGQQISRQLRERLEAIDPQLLAFSPAYSELLRVEVEDEIWLQRDPEDRRRSIQHALKALLLRLTETRPVVMVFEDLHWLDDETFGVLDSIVESLGAARLLLIVTHRLHHQERWSTKPYFARQRLDPFSAEETSAFLDACLGAGPELSSLRGKIAERAIGTPLFVEELVRDLIETALLVGSPGQYRITRNVDDIEIPQTVQTIIAARIDRLPPEAKDVLQAASVIGSAVPAPLLADAAGLDDDALAKVLAPLQENGFLFETQIVPEIEYTFKHALVRDVALSSISRRRRSNLHRAIVSSIESRYQNRADQYLDQLAYHSQQGQLWEQAVNYGERAAKRALDLSAYGLSVRHFDNALQSLTNLPEDPKRLEQSIDLRLALRAPLGAIGNIVRMHDRLHEASRLARNLKDDDRAAAISVSQTFAYNYTGELAKAKVAGTAGLEHARSTRNNELIVAGTYHLAQTHLWSGDYNEAIELLMPVVGLATGPFRQSRIGTAGTMSVLVLGMLGMAEAYVGRFTDADRHIDEAIAIADQLERPYDQAISRWYKGFAQSQLGVHDQAVASLEDAFRRCSDAEIVFLSPVVATSLGFAYASAGRLNDAAEVLQRALGQYDKTGLKYGIAYASLNLASVMMQAGDAQRLVTLLGQATELAVVHGFAGVEVGARRLQAIAAGLLRTPAQEARAAADQALALAEQKRMGPDIAHTHLLLARMCGREGDRDGAKAHAQQALSRYRSMGMTQWLERASKMLSPTKA